MISGMQRKCSVRRITSVNRDDSSSYRLDLGSKPSRCQGSSAAMRSSKIWVIRSCLLPVQEGAHWRSSPTTMIRGASQSSSRPFRPTWLASSTITTSKESGSGLIVSATCLSGMIHAGTAPWAVCMAERAWR